MDAMVSHVSSERLVAAGSSPNGGWCMRPLVPIITLFVFADSADPPAHFCAFDCSQSGRFSGPGRCFTEKKVFDTMGVDWITIPTRDETMLPQDKHILEDWARMIKGNFTWEGWFRLKKPVSDGNTLMGTYGANHDWGGGGATRITYQTGATRRRYATVTVKPNGMLTLEINAGVSSGSVQHRISMNDGDWHHVAAVFTPHGGSQIEISFRVMWIHWPMFASNAGLRPVVEQYIKEVIADIAGSGTVVDDLTIQFGNALEKPSPVIFNWGIFVSLIINTRPELLETKIVELTSKDRVADKVTAAIKMVPNVHLAVAPNYFIEDITIQIEQVSSPTFRDSGTARLFVDHYPAESGWVNFAANGENIGNDGEFVLCGGRTNVPIDCQVSRFRLWTMELTTEKFQRFSSCIPPDIREVIGGPPPHGLLAALELNNVPNATNPVGSLLDGSSGLVFEHWIGNLLTLPTSFGEFVQGGLCHYSQCPTVSPPIRGVPGCPLVKGSEIRFRTIDDCERYSRHNFCRKAGESRGRPPRPGLNGCHVGGTVSSITRSQSWHWDLGNSSDE